MNIISRSADALAIDTPAKINLFLEVLNKRSDGFHNIYSLFQGVSLYDRLEFRRRPELGVKLTVSSQTELPDGKENLVCRAFGLLQERFDLKQGLAIHLTKRIPIAAGLAGGSSDAAATLGACNILYDLELSGKQLAELGLELGSDIPFFFSSGQALVSGRGEKIEPVEVPWEYYLALITPPVSSLTASAYAELGRSLTDSANTGYLTDCRTVETFIQSLEKRANHFEPLLVRKFPVLEEIRAVLLQAGAELVRMSGSGPTMFGLFTENPEERLNRILNPEQGWQIFVVTPVLFAGNDIVS